LGQAVILTRGPSTDTPYWLIETTCSNAMSALSDYFKS